jgi:signal-transduction protein with cAMP-binding, CBS, and nucleotidyltransferase domain
MKQRKECTTDDLINVDVLNGLKANELQEVGDLCIFKSYAKGEYCGHVNEPAEELLIVNKGKVTIELRIDLPPYNQKLSVAKLSKGQICAWSALVEPNVLTSSIMCVEPSEIIAIKASDLHRLFKKNPNIELVIMRNLTKIIASRLRDSHKQFMNLVTEMIKQGHW